MIRRSHAVASLLCVTMISALVACAGGSGRGGSGAADATVEANRAALAPIAMPTVAETKPRDYPGIHNAVAYHPGFISGSQPEGDKGDKNAGFKTLAAMGIRTIITVDGAEPNVEEAKKYGMKYIHLPIGYNGFDEERELQLTRATRDAMKDGPVYIHCHHGKHRSAGAAATIATNLGWETAEQGVARMNVSGTAANYTGLFACAAEARPIDKATLDAVDAQLPRALEAVGLRRGHERHRSRLRAPEGDRGRGLGRTEGPPGPRAGCGGGAGWPTSTACCTAMNTWLSAAVAWVRR